MITTLVNPKGEEIMFIIVAEDGTLSCSNELPEELIQASEDGLLTIINVANLTEHQEGDEWLPIKPLVEE